LNETAPVPRGVSQAPTELLARRFSRQAAEFASAAARVRGAQDPQAFHDLRSSALALGVMLGMWSGLLDARPRRAALRGLRRLRRRLGTARQLEAYITLLGACCRPAAEGSREPVLSLLEDLRLRLRVRTERAARLLRPRRLRPLWARIGSASASLGTGRDDDARAFDRARAYLLGRRATARIAVEMALAHENDWLLRRARLGVETWRHALDSVSGTHTSDPDPGPVLRRLEEILDAALDRAALIAAIERRHRDGIRPGGFETVLGQLRAEKQAAFARFRTLAAAHGAHSPTRPSTARVPRITHAPGAARPASSSPGERWERMAQWLLGKGRER